VFVAAMMGVGITAASTSAAQETPGTSGASRNVAAAATETTEWFRIEFDGQHAGYESLTTLRAESEPFGAEPLLRRSRTTRLMVKRLSSPVSLSSELKTIETIDGRLQSWSLRRTSADSGFLERSGSWQPDTLAYEIVDQVSGGRRVRTLVTGRQARSPLITSWLVAASGDSTRLWSTPVLFPETAGVATLQIDPVGPQTRHAESGARETVARWDYWPEDAPDRRTIALFNEQRLCVQVEQPLLGRTLRWIRTDAASALGRDSLAELDLQLQTAIVVRQSPREFDAQESVTWKFASTQGDHLQLPESSFQKVEQVSPQELLVTVQPVIWPGPDDAAGRLAMASVDPATLASSSWINLDDPELQSTAARAAGGSSLVRERCQRLTRFVSRELKFSPFSTSLQPASEILRNKRGDCTEHAVLLTALLRSQKIPARVAAGFVYVPRPESLVAHMWVEAFADGLWMPLDSARGAAAAGVDYVKVTDSTLAGDVAGGAALFVPLLDFPGRVTVDAIVD
jgi:transglutaminase-like putative cysteine protease